MIDNEYEFRRGYNYGFSDGNAEGKAWEQRRIIKLLENDYWHHLSYLPRLVEDKATLVHDKECLGCQLLTFIKGEN
jgi:hypothetical protein